MTVITNTTLLIRRIGEVRRAAKRWSTGRTGCAAVCRSGPWRRSSWSA